MKIADGFVLRRIIDEWVVVPIGNKASQAACMLSLNESSALLWEALEKGCDESALTDILCGNYLVEEDTALSDVSKFLRRLEEIGALIHD